MLGCREGVGNPNYCVFQGSIVYSSPHNSVSFFLVMKLGVFLFQPFYSQNNTLYLKIPSFLISINQRKIYVLIRDRKRYIGKKDGTELKKQYL